MTGFGSDSDIGYNTTQEFWDEIVLASAARFKADPTRAHAMAVAIYVTQFLDWVFYERNPGHDTGGNPAYAAFKRRHHLACPELAWLQDLADVAKHRALGRKAAGLLKREGAAFPLVLELGDGTCHAMDEMVARAIAYWRASR